MSTAPAPVLDGFDRWAQRLADRTNPIVVKEVRQGMRTRVFWVFFTLMLLACCSISLISFAVASDGDLDTGRGTFIAFFVCLSGVQFFVIPYTAYRSMAREAEEETWVLLTLTGLGPRKILFGKMTSFFAQGLLYSSACAPFLLFSYYLNGIDLPSILVSMVWGVAWQLFLTSVAVSAATLADSRIVRAFLHFVLLGALLQATGMGIGGAAAVAEEMNRFVASDIFWVMLVGSLFITVTTAVLLFESAASRLALSSENYAKGPRLAMTVQFAGLVGLFVWAYGLTNEYGMLVGASCVCAVYLFAVGGFIVSDVDGMRRSQFKRDAVRHMFKPGALRGFMLVVLLQVAATLIFGSLLMADAKTEAKGLALALAAPLFSLLYLSLPMLVSRWVPHLPQQLPALTRLFGVGLFIFAVGVPPLIGAFGDDAGSVVLNLLNPIWGLVNIGASEEFPTFQLTVVGMAAALSLVFTFVSLKARDVEPTA